MSDGLLFVGVDGVLNPYDVPRGADLPGYETYYRKREWNPGGYVQPTRWGVGPIERGTRVMLNPAHGQMLLDVATRWDLELAWASWWGDDAPALIAPVLGLPAMPVVPMFPSTATPGANPGRRFIKAFAQDRPFAWLADWFGADDHVWAASRQIRKHIPTFVWKVDPGIGLTRKDVDVVDTYFWGMR